MPKRYLLNLSGHPVPQKKVDGMPVLSFPVEVEFINDRIKLFDNLFQFVKNVWEGLDDKVKKSAAAGLVSLILPGHSAIAAFVLAAWHAISGHFPKIYVWVRSDEGFQLVGPLDLQSVREVFRQQRPFYIN